MDFSEQKSSYRALAAERADWPVFMQPWWLDAVSPLPDDWGAVVHRSAKTGRIEGAMPYFWKRRGPFFSQLGLPPLTPCLGAWAWIPDNLVKRSARLEREHEILGALFRNLPKADFLKTNFHRSMPNGLPAHWAGCRVEARFTLVLERPIELGAAWDGLRSNVRGHVEKARRQLRTGPLDDGAAFFSLLEKTFERLRKPLPAGRSTVERLFKIGSERGQLACRAAFDEENELVAAVLLAIDGQAIDLLLSASGEGKRQSGALYLLYWEAVEMAAAAGLDFDFDGSMAPVIEQVFRGFGGLQRPYWSVFKARNRFLSAVHAFWKHESAI